MAARDLVPFPLRPAIKRGAAFDRFAYLGEHRARPLLGPGPLKQQRHPALCFLAGISRGEPFVGAERLRQATPGFENACREQIGFSGVEIRRARQYRQQRAVRKPVPRMLARNFVPGGTIDISYKDQELETTFAKHLGVPLLLANVTQQVYQISRAAGLNKEDGSSIIKVFERMAGVTIGGDDD
jgi:hypothetical protein